VFALFWLLTAVLLELIAIGPLFIFFYVLIGVAGARELNPDCAYADDFAAEEYQTPSSCRTDFENLLDIAI
jgi:hypothetical protein